MKITVLIYAHGFAMCSDEKIAEYEAERCGVPLRTVKCTSAQEVVEATYKKGSKAQHSKTIYKMWKEFINQQILTT
jgi:hypothetical protein